MSMFCINSFEIIETKQAKKCSIDFFFTIYFFIFFKINFIYKLIKWNHDQSSIKMVDTRLRRFDNGGFILV